MSDTLPQCPESGSEHAYEVDTLLVCPMCGHEWVPGEAAESAEDGPRVITDAVGHVLADPDTVTVVKKI